MPVLELMFAGHFRLGELIAMNGSDVQNGMISATQQRTGPGCAAHTKYGQHERLELLEHGHEALEAMPRVIGDTPIPG